MCVDKVCFKEPVLMYCVLVFSFANAKIGASDIFSVFYPYAIMFVSIKTVVIFYYKCLDAEGSNKKHVVIDRKDHGFK